MYEAMMRLMATCCTVLRGPGAVRQVTFFPDFARFGMRNLEEEQQCKRAIKPCVSLASTCICRF